MAKREGRLIESAYSSSKRTKIHAARKARRAYLIGDVGTAHSLEPIIGTSYSRDIYTEFVREMREVDPSGERAIQIAREVMESSKERIK